MDLTGITIDVPVSDLSESRSFYDVVLGRAPDRGSDVLVEWIMTRQPEIALRLAEGEAVRPDRFRIGLGVGDVERERARLTLLLPNLPKVSTRPGVISQLELTDPDGYSVVLWQDLLAR